MTYRKFSHQHQLELDISWTMSLASLKRKIATLSSCGKNQINFFPELSRKCDQKTSEFDHDRWKNKTLALHIVPPAQNRQIYMARTGHCYHHQCYLSDLLINLVSYQDSIQCHWYDRDQCTITEFMTVHNDIDWVKYSKVMVCDATFNNILFQSSKTKRKEIHIRQREGSYKDYGYFSSESTSRKHSTDGISYPTKKDGTDSIAVQNIMLMGTFFVREFQNLGWFQSNNELLTDNNNPDRHKLFASNINIDNLWEACRVMKQNFSEDAEENMCKIHWDRNNPGPDEPSQSVVMGYNFLQTDCNMKESRNGIVWYQRKSISEYFTRRKLQNCFLKEWMELFDMIRNMEQKKRMLQQRIYSNQYHPCLQSFETLHYFLTKTISC